jgi:hypothetical protein
MKNLFSSSGIRWSWLPFKRSGIRVATLSNLGYCIQLMAPTRRRSSAEIMGRNNSGPRGGIVSSESITIIIDWFIEIQHPNA